jgi:hypothetical protein
MKIVKNSTINVASTENTWNVHVEYANNIITTNIVTSLILSDCYQEYTNTTCSLNLSEMSSQFVDFTSFAVVADETHYELIKDSYVIDLFKMTYPTKYSPLEFGTVNSKIFYGFLIVPFADSVPEDMVYVVRAPNNINCNITHNGFSQELVPIENNEWNKFYPIAIADAFTMPKNSTVEFNIRLVDSKWLPIFKEGVTIYLETTGGNLANKRIVTDASGQAKGHITVGDSVSRFKIKTGFKNFSGIFEIPVRVV